MAGIIHLTHFSCNLRQESIWGITYIRFINEDDKYQLPLLHKIIQLKDSDEKEKQIDQYSQDEAKKWLKKYIKSLQ